MRIAMKTNVKTRISAKSYKLPVSGQTSGIYLIGLPPKFLTFFSYSIELTCCSLKQYFEKITQLIFKTFNKGILD